MDDALFRAAVREHAIFLGMDPDADKDFLWIGKLLAPVISLSLPH